MLESLREEADFTLYRGREVGNPMPILALALAAGQPSSQSLRRLEHEHSLAAELDAAWAAQPLALTRHQGRGILILKDPGGEPLDRLIGQHKGLPLDLTRFLCIAIGLAAALGQAHRQGLIHKDVKPANALVDDAGRAWLTGFGIASRLPRERVPPVPPEIIAGTLAYMSPEQTGRMNRSVDSRSDLYSLGVTLYEMLTGSLPFAGSDPMEWVHCHIARLPVSPRERMPDIPLPVSSVIMKLLAKTAEERYQTAVGLERDLQRCLKEWESGGRVGEFALGEHDMPDRLLMPEKLYGRESEINTLLASFDRVVAGGHPELVLVSGYSGVGKSSVVNELHKPLVPPRGLFASGKFDQYKRDIPYATLAQAFQYLIRPILVKNEEELGRWRDSIHEALGINGQLMVELVPELKLIIGEQQPVPELPPQDAQNRFQLVFRRFIGVFTRERPLALFLDDLQWLDAATLDLMEDLLTHPDVQHLMLIGAYRDNEVAPAHPLMRKLEAIRQTGAIVHDIVLAPLTRHDLEEVIADSLHCDRGHARPLAKLVEEKTSGNPFFAIQFISALFEEGLIVFDHAEGQWCWDLNRIHAKGYTDNVADLMVGKLSRLSIETLKALQQLACLGNSADFAMLRMVYQDSSEEMHGQLWEAVRTGLILRSEDSYRFLHDRVQEAAYSLIPQELRAATHLRIGMLMASLTSADKLEEGIFEIANQLNRGAHLVTSIAEHERIAELNLIAGRRAKISTAYASALKYLHAGRGLLTEETWNRNYDLVFLIEYLLAECELLTADMASAEGRLSLLAERAKSAHDIALVTRLRLTLYTLLDRNDRSVEVFIEYERGHGRDWSPHPIEEDVFREYDQLMSFAEARQIGALVDLPLITDPDVLDVLDVFTEVVMSAMITDKNLLALVIFRMVGLSLEHGNSDASCFAYVTLGMLAGARFGNYEAGFQFGKLSYDLVEKRGLHRYQARVYLRFGNCVMPWNRHVKAGRELVRRAFDVANRSGDLTYAGYSCNNLNTNLLATGDSLAEVQREAEKGLEFAENVRFDRVIDLITAQLALVRTLRGLTAKFGSFNDRHFDELQFERHVSGGSRESWYWIRKLQARFFAGDYASAIQASLNAKRLSLEPDSYFEVAEYHFYAALARAGAFDSATGSSQQEHFKALADHHRQLAIWAENCPENFENRAALVGAEIARIEGRFLDAEQLYETAIRSAHMNGFVHNEAVANEIAARFYAARGFDKTARAYLRDARYCYLDWGADGKVRQLDQLYPHIKDEQPVPGLTGTIEAPSGLLDLATVIKVSQALSSEIVLPRLIEKLIRIAVENAGAERGLLILLRGTAQAQGGEPRIEAEAISGPGGIEVAVRQSAITPCDLPQSALHYAIRTQERVLLGDASADIVYSTDEYVRRKRSRSLLCLPIVKQAKLVGALYLENNLAPGVFTSDRVALLQLLASQAAISLENAALYTDLQRSEAFLAQGQKISHTGTFGWSNASGEFYWSEENYNIFEYDRGVKASAELAFQRMHPDERNSVRQAFDEAVREKTDFDNEHRMLMPDGRIKHVHTTGRTVNTGNLDFVGAVRDITERKQAEEALRQALTDLARINRVTTMGELTASLAHEINQPITGAITNASACLRWLDRDKLDLDEVRAAVTRIVKDGERATQIIGRIRARFEKGALNREVFGINEIIRETVGLLRGEAVRYDISVRKELAADLPRTVGDRVQLQQVVMNLIVNSIEAMKDVDGIREMVIRSQQAENEQILVSVSDTGMGVPAQLAEPIFDPFFTTKPHGTGMGLRISRSIIESHGGRLWVTGAPGRGASFQFTLPATVADHS
ncbi:trifunctional serine/threonine-protein kinase/ATP-binding protein/sensor histidine kinase [Paraburkholderia fungorum]|uniref:trifunctional serine/threonine-protein kinase/ATP-binding protein/sensor histidine kinase n=1 Tax=Paraburkholderia fungorum TaxID=134537 RepID=UPI0038B88EB1